MKDTDIAWQEFMREIEGYFPIVDFQKKSIDSKVQKTNY